MRGETRKETLFPAAASASFSPALTAWKTRQTRSGGGVCFSCCNFPYIKCNFTKTSHYCYYFTCLANSTQRLERLASG